MRASATRRRLTEARAKGDAIVATGKCPDCGTKLYRNLALTGWWQCGHYGSPGFQREASPSHCSFQAFTSESVR